jgi:hypothetical protein
LRARKYTKKISHYRVGGTKVSDGFSGFIYSDQLLGNIWANLKTISDMKYSSTEFADIDMANTIKVTIRHNPNRVIDYKNDYFVYRNKKYFLRDVPVNKDFNNTEVTFLMTKEN